MEINKHLNEETELEIDSNKFAINLVKSESEEDSSLSIRRVDEDRTDISPEGTMYKDENGLRSKRKDAPLLEKLKEFPCEVDHVYNPKTKRMNKMIKCLYKG
jgi:hypothetical protein